MHKSSDPNKDVFEEQRDASVALTPNAVGFLDVEFDNAALKRRALTGASSTLVTQTFKFVLKFGSAIVLGRLLGPAQFGLVAMVAPILGFVSTLNDMGFSQAIVQKEDISARQISGLFWINTLISILLASVVMLAAPLIGTIYHEPRTTGITLVLGMLIALGGLGMVPNALLSRQMKFTTQAFIDIGTMTFNVVVSIGAAVAGLGYWALVLGQVATTVAGVAANWALTKWRPSRPGRGTGVGSLVNFGANLTGVNIATYFSMTADNMIVGVFGGKVMLGLYDRSYTLVVQPLSQLMLPVSRVAIPLLSRLKDTDRYRQAYISMLLLTVMLTAPAMICCCLMPGAVISLLLGSRWAAAGPIFGWICFGGILAPIFGTTGWLFTTQGRTREQMSLSIFTAVLSIAAFAVGIFWGALGVAIMSALSFNFLQTPLVILRATRIGAVRFRHVLPTLISIGISMAGAATVVTAVDVLHPPGAVFIAATLSYFTFSSLIRFLPGGSALFSSLRSLLRR
jgi:PST family polysaccharide transporter